MTPDEVLARLHAPLSLRGRVGYLAVGLAGLTGAGLIGLLLATEPGLPRRTRVAFAVLVVIGLGWASFAGWVVTRRRPLFALDRVIGAWIAAGAWLVFAAGALVIAGPAATGIVLGLGLVAAGNLWVARRRRTALLRSRSELRG